MAKLWLYQQSAGPVAPISAPTTQTITLNRLDNTNTIYDPTVVRQASNVITLNQLASTSQVFLPTVVLAAGPQTVTLNRLDNISQIFLPTVLLQGAVQTITLNRLASTTQVYLPTITLRSAVTDTSDILDRYRKRRSESKEEEEIAAQLLKARQQKPKLEKEQKALVSWKNLLYKAINGAQSIEELEAIEIPVAPVESTKLAILATEELQLAKEKKRAQFINSLNALETIAVKHEQAIKAAEQAQQQAFQQLRIAEEKALEFTTKRNNRIKRLKALMWLAKLDL